MKMNQEVLADSQSIFGKARNNGSLVIGGSIVSDVSVVDAGVMGAGDASDGSS